MRRWSWCVVTLLCAGCAFDAATESLDGPSLALEPELRIGSVNDSASALTWFRSMVVRPDGRIYTSHPQELQIRVHDVDGDPVGRIGREGEGPGEFQGVGPMGLIGDTLWVMDYSLYRISYFGPADSLLRTWNLPVDIGDGKANPPRPSGLLYDGRLLGGPLAPSQQVAAGEITQAVMLYMDTAGVAGDTLLTWPLANTTLELADPDHPQGLRSYSNQPFSDTEIAMLSPYGPDILRVDRTAGTDGPSTFRVTRLTLTGDTVFSRLYPYEPKPITDAVFDSIVEQRADRMSQPSAFGGPGTPLGKARNIVRTALYRPAHLPTVSTLVISRDGSLWLQRERAGRDSVNWSILDADGEPLGTATLPANVTLMAATRDRAWGATWDELEVPYIVRYRLAPLGASGAR